MPEDLLTETPTETPPAPWYSDDYKDVVTQRGWKEPNDVLKSYINLDSEFGKRVKIPTEESSDEERSAFYAKIGRPDNPDGYEIKDIPEGVLRNEEMEAAMRQAAYDTGVPKVAFETIVKKYYDGLAAQVNQSRIEGENALKSEWKDKYDANLEIAKRFASEGGEEFFNFLATSGIGNNPVVIKAFFNYGTKILSDSLIKGEPGKPKEGEYRPQYTDSPSMYANGDDEESKKARAWFEARGHKY